MTLNWNSEQAIFLLLKKIHKESYGTYGDSRIKEEFKSEGTNCGNNKVSRLIKEPKIIFMN